MARSRLHRRLARLVRRSRHREALRVLGARLLPDRVWIKRSYSQLGEDLLLEALLPEAMGSYVDVGANHPISFNNTWALYKRGWSGLLIDPLDESAAMCRARRPRDRFVQAAVGASCGTITFHRFDNDMASTTSAERAKQAEATGFAGRRELDVALVTLSSLELAAQPEEPTLLAIDAEFMDLEVLKGIDFDRYRPRVILVEEVESPLRGATAISELLAEQGYELGASTIFNSIYVHRRWSAAQVPIAEQGPSRA
jgi:FkbM family methyltransferase